MAAVLAALAALFVGVAIGIFVGSLLCTSHWSQVELDLQFEIEELREERRNDAVIIDTQRATIRKMVES